MRLTPYLVAAMAVLAACSGPAKDKEAADAKPSALIRTGVVQTGVMPEIVTAYGAAETTLSADRSVVAPVDSAVTKLLVAVGDMVSTGQAVATLQPGPLVALELTRAMQDAATSRAALARALRLRATGLVGDAEVETARSAATTAQATAQSLRVRLTGVVRAPISGIVQSVGVAPGGFATAGTAIVTVGSVTGTRVRLGLDPLEATRVHVGDAVRLAAMTDARQGTSRVLSVDPRADAQTRQASAYVGPPSGATFAAGEPLKGEITVATRSGVALVPRVAVLYDGEKPYLFVVSGGVAHRREVSLGVGSPVQVEVRGGVRAGDHIALDGGTALADGMAVREAGGR